MLLPHPVVLRASATIVALFTLVAAARAGGLDPGLCHATTGRASIPSNFGVDACFDGAHLTLRNSITLALDASKSGDVANPSRRESDYGLAADAERLKSNDPTIFLPGDELVFPVGSGAGTVGIRGSSDNGFYAIATTIADFFPGKPNAIVGVFTGFVSEINDDFTQYHTCLAGKNWFAQLGCRALLVRNVTFAAGRGVVSGGAKSALGAILSGYTWSKWVSANVADAGASLHQSGLIRIAAASRSPGGTAPPPSTTTSATPGKPPANSAPARGDHALRTPVDLCAIAAIRRYVASVYQTSEPVACAPETTRVSGETPPTADDNWYFPTIPNSGSPDTGDGRISVEIFNDHTQYTSHFWQDQLADQASQPQRVRSAGGLNGVRASWAFGYILTTPYGATQDLQVFVFADLDGQTLPNAEDVAKTVATLVETAAFQ